MIARGARRVVGECNRGGQAPSILLFPALFAEQDVVDYRFWFGTDDAIEGDSLAFEASEVFAAAGAGEVVAGADVERRFLGVRTSLVGVRRLAVADEAGGAVELA